MSRYQLNQPGYGETIELKTATRTPWLFMLLLVAGAGAAGYWGFGERNRLMGRATAAEVAAAKAETDRKLLEQEMKTLQEQNQRLEAARENLTRSMEKTSSALAELQGTYEKLQDKMKDEIAHGDVTLSRKDGRLQVDLVDKILFESGDAQISKRGEGVLGRVGGVLATIEDRQIQVSGHTDDAPISKKLQEQFPTNWELSVARATNVLRFLQDSAKVPPERLVATGYGEFKPVASNKSARGKARNRRIELLLLPSLAPKKISASSLQETSKRSHKK